MNKALEKLYKSKWDKLLEEAKKLHVKAANPLLIKVKQSYIESDVKVMIVGQETDRWCDELNKGERTVESLMSSYYGYFYQETKDGQKREKRPFWNNSNFKYFETEISQYYKDKGKKVAFVWSNISKIGNAGRGKGKPHEEIRTLEREYFNVFAQEVGILKPDIIIFTTGHTRDRFINFNFDNDVEFTAKLRLTDDSLANEEVKLLDEVKLKKFPQIKCLRTEHPNRRAVKNEVIFKVLEQMLKS